MNSIAESLVTAQANLVAAKITLLLVATSTFWLGAIAKLLGVLQLFITPALLARGICQSPVHFHCVGELYIVAKLYAIVAAPTHCDQLAKVFAGQHCRCVTDMMTGIRAILTAHLASGVTLNDATPDIRPQIAGEILAIILKSKGSQ